MQEKKTKIAVFLSSGIGDAVLMVPLLKLLKRNVGNHISILLNSHFIDEEFLIFNNFPFDEIISFKNKDLWKRQYFHYFDKTYLDFSSSSVKNLILASFLSKKTYAYSKKHIPLPGIKYLNAKAGMHAAVLNANLIDRDINESGFSLELMRLSPNSFPVKMLNDIKSRGIKIIAVQISSGNNETKYKNWPVEYWIQLIRYILDNYPGFYIILLGDKNEIAKGNTVVSKINSRKVISFIGKTTLREAANLLYHSEIYLGLDSAFMHLAAAYDIPSFTILGASSENFIGYHKFNSAKHFVIYKNLSCRPCHTMINPNRSKVKNPNLCDDIECLVTLYPEQVILQFKKFIDVNVK